MDEIKTLLDEEIKEGIESLNGADLCDDNYTKATDNLAKLYKLKIEEEKNEKDRKDQRVQRLIGYGVDLTKFGVSLIAYYGLYKLGLKFEETGTVNAHPVRDLIGSMNPFKKLK